MLKDRLKEMDLRITELAEYLHVSRPTMYKFIECYDKKQFKALSKEALQLFNYIVENELVGKRSVISFILTKLSGDSAADDIEGQVMNYLKSNPDSKKSLFIKECVTSDSFDKVVYYLADIIPILKSKSPSEDERNLLAPYVELIKNLTETNH